MKAPLRFAAFGSILFAASCRYDVRVVRPGPLDGESDAAPLEDVAFERAIDASIDDSARSDSGITEDIADVVDAHDRVDVWDAGDTRDAGRADSNCVPWTRDPTGALYFRGESQFEEATDATLTDPGGRVILEPGVVGDAFDLRSLRMGVVSFAPAHVPLYGREITVELWVRPMRAGEYRLVDRVTPYAGDGWLLDTEGPNLRWGVAGAGFVYSDEPLPVDAWTHVAAVSDGREFYLYINGVRQRQQRPYSLWIPGGMHSIVLGSDRSGSALFYGMLDEVLVAPFALTEPEVRAGYEGRTRGRCPLR